MDEFGIPLNLGIFYAGVFGALVGSYLNVVIYRLPRGLSTLRPRSRCPRCKHNIAWYDNLPVVSYLLLRASCRYCKAHISMRYPLVEFTVGVLFAAAFARYTWSVSTLIAFLLIGLLVSLALIDAEHFLLPDALTLPGLIIGLGLSFFSEITDPLSAALGAVIGAAVLLLMIAAYFVLRGQMGMGLGDPKMLAMIGSFLGAPKTIVTLLIASLTGTILSLALIALKKANSDTRLPFGVYLSIGALVALLFGDRLVALYLGV